MSMKVIPFDEVDYHGQYVDKMFVAIAKSDIRIGNTRRYETFLKKLRERIKKDQIGIVSIVFQGYETNKKEVFEIPIIRKFISKLDTYFPYWLDILDFESYATIQKCLLPIEVVSRDNGMVGVKLNPQDVFALTEKHFIQADNKDRAITIIKQLFGHTHSSLEESMNTPMRVGFF